jgi:alpha-tubulin suppressor-like RCC1 family protein
VCWGADTYAELGNGAAVNASFDTPVPVPNVSNVTAIAAGGSQTCALVSDTWECWGADPFGALGPQPATSCFGAPCDLTPTPLFGAGITAFATGTSVTCAVISGSVECMGNNTTGELGLSLANSPDTCLVGGQSSPCSTSPVVVSTSLDVTALSLFDTSVCALVSGGSVACWGDDSEGQIGANGAGSMCGNGPCSPTPVTVPGVSNATAIATGESFACALIRGGTVECWGINDLGQLGQAETATCEENQNPCSVAPLSVTGLSNATAIAAGSDFACAIIQGGMVECWGSDFSLGNAGSTADTCQGGNSCSVTPVQVTGVTDAVAITAGEGTACALLQSGGVQCWGQNSSGEGGNGTESAEVTAASVQW